MLTVNTEYREGILFVRLKGVLNKETIQKLNKKVTTKVRENGIRNIVFNLEKLKQIDIKGINALLYNYELCKANDGISLLCGNNDHIKNRLKTSHILNYMNEISNELCAIKIINMRVK